MSSGNYRLIEKYHTHSVPINLGISTFLVVILYQVKYGLGMLNPANIGWLMQWDFHGYVVMLDMYRHEPWGFPLGQVHGYFYPIGANLGEILPMLVKLLSPILPEKFQYIGPFLLLNHLLVAYFSLRLFKLFNVHGLTQLLCSLFIVFNPVLLYRFVHPSLTTHWFILASLLLFFESTKAEPYRVMIYQAGLLVLSGLIMPYMAVIEAGFLVTLGFKLWAADRRISFLKFGSYVVSSMILLLLSWYLIGLLTFSHSVDLDVPNQFGLYGWNLSSFFNAYEYDLNSFYKTNNLSAIIPSKPMTGWQQYEGFSYLGIGMMILILISAVLYFRRKRSIEASPVAEESGTKLYPLIILAVLFTLFAISNTVSFNDHILFKVPIPSLFQKFGDIFRASGRFIWVVYYLILIGVLCFLSRAILSTAILSILLIITLGLQLYDIKKLIFTQKFSYEPYHTPLHDEQWERLMTKFDRVLFYPPFRPTNLSHDDYRYFTYFAANQRKPISTGYLGRVDFVSAREFTLKMQESFKQGSFEEETLYITLPQYVPMLVQAALEKKIKVLAYDGYVIFFSSSRMDDLGEIPLQIEREENQQTLEQFFEMSTPVQSKINEDPGHSIKLGFYEVTESKTFAYIKGWAFLDESSNLETDSVRLLLQSGTQTWAVPARRFLTPDVADYFKNPALVNAGFASIIPLKDLKTARYQIGISIYNKNIHQEGHMWSSESLGSQRFMSPSIRSALPKASEAVKQGLTIDVDNESEVKIKGWGFLENLRSRWFNKYVTLSSTDKIYSVTTIGVPRKDVVSYFNDPALINTGFEATFLKDSLKKGIYRVGLVLRDSLDKTEYYVLTDKLVTIGFSKLATPSKLEGAPTGNEAIRSYIDKAEDNQSSIKISGWAFIENLSTDNSEALVVLKSENGMYQFITTPVVRGDIQDYFKLSYQVDMAGFSLEFRKKDLDPGTYQVCILMLNKKTKVQTLQCLPTTIKL